MAAEIGKPAPDAPYLSIMTSEIVLISHSLILLLGVPFNNVYLEDLNLKEYTIFFSAFIGAKS